MRVKFRNGEQRKFLDLVVERTSSPSLRGLLQFGLNVKYSALKNYHSESRLMPENLFLDLCKISGTDFEKTTLLGDNWGKVKGGKKSKRKGISDEK